MCVALPVDPQLKTLSEAATISFVQCRMKVPVPSVIVYDASNDNNVKFEWIFMEYIEGSTLWDVWHAMEWEKKVLLVRRLGRHIAELSRERFSRIGNLYKRQDLSDPVLVNNRHGQNHAPDYVVDKIVSEPYLLVRE